MNSELKSLALDLAWSWDPRLAGLFRALAPDVWQGSAHNPIAVLGALDDSRLDEALRRPEVRAALETARGARRERAERRPAFYDAGAPLRIGYFSLEFGLTEALPNYSGGLGILAGDHLKAAGDLGLPLVGVGLLYRFGFGHQRLDADGEQTEYYTKNDFARLPLELAHDADGELVRVECPLGDRTVKVQVWKVQVGAIPLYLLDTDLDENAPDLRSITDRLYPSEGHLRLPQEMVLGIGGVRALRALGIQTTVLHMNEGHGFLVAIERMRELRQERRLSLPEARLFARAGFVFTTHTPVAAGSDYFGSDLVAADLGPYLNDVGIDLESFMDLGRARPGDFSEALCSTFVGLRMADSAVGVSRLHGAVSRRLWKDAWPRFNEAEVPIGAVTNGVHLPSWVAPEIASLLERHVDREWWDLPPEHPSWAGVEAIPDEDLWHCHGHLRRRLTEFAFARSDGERLDPDALTIGFSRRFAKYKRAGLLAHDPARLQALLTSADRPLQLVFSGKAHPADREGKEILHRVVGLARREPRFVFLEDYDMGVARYLVQGADVWLNNPRRFLEASGTSGMKAGANGVLNLSVLDGWWDEGYRPSAGWAIPSAATMDRQVTDDAAEAEALYGLLEGDVLPAFYQRDARGIPVRWVAMMRDSIRLVATRFSARRMVLDYFWTCYAPAARRVEQLRTLPQWGG
ncbi:MAG: alpha-glucan family phosphorylase [Candidatus Dormibacteraeota bacterium]|nr:alpha-glucan family phosphorylase [Candidatus Dormibacteraeota bacterium]